MSRASGPPTSVGNAVAKLVGAHADDLRENLPRPGRSWEWVECDLDPSLQQRLAESSDNHLVKDDETGLWRTSEEFYSYVVYRLGTSEDGDGIGTDLGQESLFAPGREPSPGKGRVDTDLQPRTSRAPEQVTLTGDSVTVETGEVNENGDHVGEIKRNGAKGPGGDGEDPAAGALPLGFWAGEWEGPTAGSFPFDRPAGTVY